MPPVVAVPAPGDLAMCKLIIISHKTDTSMSGVGELFLHCRWPGYLWWLCWRGLVMCMLTVIHHNIDVGMSDVGGLFLCQRWLCYCQWLCWQ